MTNESLCKLTKAIAMLHWLNKIPYRGMYLQLRVQITLQSLITFIRLQWC